jgi:hypothetical protein
MFVERRKVDAAVDLNSLSDTEVLEIMAIRRWRKVRLSQAISECAARLGSRA